jgi:outer membrane protein assembly factor BamB
MRSLAYFPGSFSRHLGLVGMLLLLACNVAQVAAQKAAPQPRHAWKLTAPHLQENKFQASAGTLHGTLLGPAQFADSAPQALALDGKRTEVQIATISKQNPAEKQLPTQAISVESWIYPTRIQAWGGIVSAIQDNGSYERGWMLGTREDMFCFGLTSESKRRLTYLTNPQPFLPGNWYHVVGTYDGKQLKLFVDGRLRAQSTAQQGPIAYPPEGTVVLGAYRDADEHHPTQGQIGQAAIFDQALSDAEILARFRRDKKPYPNVDPVPSSVVGWPTYNRDLRRSGYTPETLKLPLSPGWTYQAMQPPAPAWPAPAKQDFWHNKDELPARVTYDRAFHLDSDGRRLIFDSSAEDHVTCIDAHTAVLQWRFTTEGPVRLAPTIDQGRVYFGSDDGFAYCLDLHQGKLLWKYRAAPSDRRIPGNQRIISAWPVRSGVVVDRGQARFSAGLFPAQGTYQFAVDAQAGTLVAKGALNFSPQGYLQRRGTRLMVAHGRNPTPQRIGDLSRTDKPLAPDESKTVTEFPHATIYSGPTRYAGGNDKVAAFDSDGKTLWSAAVRGKPYSLAIAGNRLFVSTDEGAIHCFAPGIPSSPPREIIERPALDPDSLFYDTTDERLAYEQRATRILAAGRKIQGNALDQGYCLVLGTDQGKLAYELSKRSKMQIIALMDQAHQVASTREAFRQAGLYGRVVVHEGSLKKLGYSSDLFNLVCIDQQQRKTAPTTPLEEVYRLLRPAGGIAVVDAPVDNHVKPVTLRSWADRIPPNTPHRFDHPGLPFVLRRAPRAATGDWTHMYAGPENTACSKDELVSGQLELQWFGRPGPQNMVDRHHRTVPPLVVGGRMFLPGNNRIIGVDAYNGTVLWETPIEDFRRVGAMRDSGSMVAASDLVYAVARDKCYLLESGTGKILRHFSTPTRPDKTARHWGYVAHVGDHLYGSATRVGAARRQHSRQQIDETYYDFIPIVTSDSLFCRDRLQGQLHWNYQPTGSILNPTITITANRVFLVESSDPITLQNPGGRATLQQLLGKGSRLVALDRLSGKVIWKKPTGLQRAQHHLFLGHSKGTLIAVSTRNQGKGAAQQVWYDIHAFSAQDGKPLWQSSQNQRSNIGGSHGEQDHHPAIVGDIVYVEPYAYHLDTGIRRENWRMDRNGHGCGTISASASACFFRAGHPTMCDLATGKFSKVTQVSRPGCWINMIPAGGLLLIPEASSGCTCDFPIQTSMAFRPVSRVRSPAAKP